MDKVLRKVDLINLIGVPATTLSHWIKKYNTLITTHKRGDITYFGSEAVIILKKIKDLRSEGYNLESIRKILLDQPPTFLNNGESYHDNSTDQLNRIEQTLKESNEMIRELKKKIDVISSYVATQEQNIE